MSLKPTPIDGVGTGCIIVVEGSCVHGRDSLTLGKTRGGSVWEEKVFFSGHQEWERREGKVRR